MALLKKCGRCKRKKPLSYFSRNRLKKDGYSGTCKPCQSIAAKNCYARRKEKITINRALKLPGPVQRQKLNWQSRAEYLEHQRFVKKAKRYKLTIEEAKILSGGSCAICCEYPDTNHKGPAQRSLHIDHDHETGHVRGALCYSCNTGLERFRDRSDLLIKAAEYLEESFKKDS